MESTVNRPAPVPWCELRVYVASNTTPDLLNALGALDRTVLNRAENETVSAILSALAYRFPDEINAACDAVLARPPGRISVFDRSGSLASRIITAILAR